ncbi:hypothetical protein DPMN_051004 [Dreissena polymorpha]|uniref:Uncharacterized protein n=1 Tax=Dreissena polymorpha TaxID=45954 RepID=A0A9D4HMW4_DREPO|nr:hypothetical protein DPMN_051004 [Dreissena polymorpha]
MATLQFLVVMTTIQSSCTHPGGVRPVSAHFPCEDVHDVGAQVPHEQLARG